MTGIPILSFLLFLGLWSFSAAKIEASLGAIPGPVAVWHEASGLKDDHKAERDKQVAFYERQKVGKIEEIYLPRFRLRKALLEHTDYYRYRESLLTFLQEGDHSH